MLVQRRPRNLATVVSMAGIVHLPCPADSGIRAQHGPGWAVGRCCRPFPGILSCPQLIEQFRAVSVCLQVVFDAGGGQARLGEEVRKQGGRDLMALQQADQAGELVLVDVRRALLEQGAQAAAVVAQAALYLRLKVGDPPGLVPVMGFLLDHLAPAVAQGVPRDLLAGLQVDEDQEVLFLAHAQRGALVTHGHGVTVALPGDEPGLVRLASLPAGGSEIDGRGEVWPHVTPFVPLVALPGRLARAAVVPGIGRGVEPFGHVGFQVGPGAEPLPGQGVALDVPNTGLHLALALGVVSLAARIRKPAAVA